MQGALISVQELGIGILNIRDESFFDDAIVQLAKRDRGAKRLSPPRETLWATPAEQLLTSLPGVGPETADALLTECKGNAGLALAALTNARIAPAGISATRRTAIRTALGLASDQYLTIYNESDTDDDNRLSHDRQALAGA